jgi:phosphomannomutase/phosphoglucomutase
MTMTLLLDIMAQTGQTLSKLVAEQPQYFIEKGKIECPDDKKDPLLQKLHEQAKGENISTIDGIKIWFNDNSAILVRPSGTEPVFRLYAEAKNQEKALKLVKDYTSKLEKILETL